MSAVVRLSVISLIVALSTGCLGPVRGVYPPAPGEKAATVYLVNHGWHTGLVVATAALDGASRPGGTQFAGKPYVEIGWGDERYYRAGHGSFGITSRAILWPTRTVLHCVAVDQPVDDFYDKSGIVEVKLSEAGLDGLRSFLASCYQRDDDGNQVDLGPGIYGSSRFYRSGERYYIPNTCNRWTARALRAGGCPISPFYAIRARNVFRQAAKFGHVVRDFYDEWNGPGPPAPPQSAPPSRQVALRD